MFQEGGAALAADGGPCRSRSQPQTLTGAVRPPLTFLPQLARVSRGATSLRGGWWGVRGKGSVSWGLQTGQTGA